MHNSPEDDEQTAQKLLFALAEFIVHAKDPGTLTDLQLALSRLSEAAGYKASVLEMTYDYRELGYPDRDDF